MRREAKGQNDALEAVSTLLPLADAAHGLPSSTAWPVPQQRTEGPALEDLGSVEPLPSPRWFDLVDPETLPAEAPPRSWRWTIALLVAAAAVVAVGHGLLLRAIVPLVLAAAAGAVFVRGRRAPPPRLPAPVSRRGLSLDDDRLLLHGKGHLMSHALLATSERFGVTLLATPRRDRVVALLSSSAGMSYVGASFDPASRRAFGALLDRACTVSADEVGLEAIGPDGEPIALAPATLTALVDELVRRSPGCLERFLLTDARGAALSVDGRELSAGGSLFDLAAPLEWRAFVFQEALGQAIAVYQGTWVRQASSEVVLVCLLPAMTPAQDGSGIALSSLDRGALRDLRLMQGAPESPPAPDQRVAVDRLLMVPIRSALDKAPRAAVQAARARA